MSKLADCINKWIKKSDKEFKCDRRIEEDYIIQHEDAMALSKAIQMLQMQKIDQVNASISGIMYILQERSYDKKTFDVLNDEVLPLLISLFKSLELNKSSKMFLLKLCALYSNVEGHLFIVDSIKNNFGSKEYLWDIIFDIISGEKETCQLIAKRLGSIIPRDFCGITYLDMCNRAMHEGFLEDHPFDSEEGIKFIKDMYNLKDVHDSYKSSIAGVIPFLNNSNFKKIEDIIDKDVKSFAELENFHDKKEVEIQRILSDHTGEGLKLIIPCDDNYPIYLYPNSPHRTAFSTLDLSNIDNAPLPNQYGTYELVMFTKISTGGETKKDDDHLLNKILMRSRTTLNAIGSYSFNATLKPRDTITIPEKPPIHLVMDKLEKSDFEVDQIPHHLLLLIEIFESELNFARKEGSASLIQKLKDTNNYPFSDMDRNPVA